MKTLIPKDFKPTERDYELIWNSQAIPKEWADHQTTEWREYWIDCKEKKSSWRTTWRNWIYSLWEKVDKSRLYREQRKIFDMTEDVLIKKPTEIHTTNTTSPPEIRLKDYQQEMIDNIDKCV